MNPVNPIITIDRERCTTPFDCKHCLRICPPAVFMVHTVKMVRGELTDRKEPGAYLLTVPYRDKCSGCMKCVEVCPVDALTIAMPQEVPA